MARRASSLSITLSLLTNKSRLDCIHYLCMFIRYYYYTSISIVDIPCACTLLLQLFSVIFGRTNN